MWGRFMTINGKNKTNCCQMVQKESKITWKYAFTKLWYLNSHLLFKNTRAVESGNGNLAKGLLFVFFLGDDVISHPLSDLTLRIVTTRPYQTTSSTCCLCFPSNLCDCLLLPLGFVSSVAKECLLIKPTREQFLIKTRQCLQSSAFVLFFQQQIESYRVKLHLHLQLLFTVLFYYKCI